MINCICKTIEILNLLAASDGSYMQLQEIAAGTGLPKSTCIHILQTLIDKKYVEHPSRTTGYRLGFGVFLLTRFGRYGHQLCDVAHPVLEWVQRKTGQSANLVILRDGKRLTIDFVCGELPLSPYGENLVVDRIFNSATGRVLLAYMNEAELTEFCAQYGLPTANDWEIMNVQQLKKRLAEIRKNGYETLFLANPERYGYATPVMRNGKCIAALGLAFYDNPNKDYLRCLFSAAKEIKRRLDFNGEIKL